MNTTYLIIGLVLVVILIGGIAWWMMGSKFADGAVFADGGNTKWAYIADSNSLIASRTSGDTSGVFAKDMKTIKFSPSGVVMTVTMDGKNIRLSNGDTLRAL